MPSINLQKQKKFVIEKNFFYLFSKRGF